MSTRLVLLLASLIGCGGPPPAARPAPVDNTVAPAELADRRLDDTAPHLYELTRKEQVDPGADPAALSVSALKTLAVANQTYVDGDLPGAAVLYRRLVDTFPYSKYAASALYNLALVHERNGNVDDAVTTLVRVHESYHTTEVAAEALLRAAALRARDQDWDAAVELLDTVGRDELAAPLRLELGARRGRALLALGRRDEAEAALAAAVDAPAAPGAEDYRAMARADLDRIGR
jgi:predicted negative regulator of RcsB-dependent stress response